jgi:hypothetical protein
MKLYEITFERKTLCRWSLEANSEKEALELSKNISDNGTFSQEEEESYNFLHCELEEEEEEEEEHKEGEICYCKMCQLEHDKLYQEGKRDFHLYLIKDNNGVNQDSRYVNK